GGGAGGRGVEVGGQDSGEVPGRRDPIHKVHQRVWNFGVDEGFDHWGDQQATLNKLEGGEPRGPEEEDLEGHARPAFAPVRRGVRGKRGAGGDRVRVIPGGFE
ncbi:hypothetical protein NGA_2122000, partial [Nannochloropsis gaditana CCMP526]|uniref:uncharacterized protein n=1 Tax=Nannochloropsis gaditana (strain CCMP526) TaxID=1093141 RepID=UPI00029F583C